MQNILIVDDHRLFSEGLKSMLEKDNNFQVFIASNGEQACNIFKKESIDLTIMDIEMPDSKLNGIELTHLLRGFKADAKILVISMNKSSATVDQIVEAQAMGYVIKDSGYTTLKDAVNSLMAGKEYWDPKILQVLVDARKRESEKNDSKTNFSNLTLTRREKEVLKELAEGLSSKAIAKKLAISSFTVSTHRKNLLAKLEANSSIEAVMKAKKKGLV